jgi:hypothetical protein
MIDYEQFKKKALSEPAVMKEYENHKAEFAIARALIKAHRSAKMTQAEVARIMLTSGSTYGLFKVFLNMPMQ